MTIQLMVEGYGEVHALPVLLRRFIKAAQTREIKIARPLRGTRDQPARKEDLQKFIPVVLKQPVCRAILVLLDGDSQSVPLNLGPVYRLGFRGISDRALGIRNDAEPFPEPEKYCGAKEKLGDNKFLFPRVHRNR